LTSLPNSIVLSCAGRRAYLARWLREALHEVGWSLVACDANAHAPALQEADRAYTVPRVTDQGYIEVIQELCGAHRAKAILSVNDVELRLLASRRKAFAQVGTHVFGAEAEVVDRCADKVLLGELAAEVGVRYPATYVSREGARRALAAGDAASVALLVKPRWGSGSIGIFTVRSPKELDAAWDACGRAVAGSVVADIQGEQSSESPVIAQELLDGTEFGLDVVNDLDACFAGCLARQKLAMRAGETDRARTVSVEALTDVGKRVSAAVGHTGLIDCDVILTEAGYHLIDINPRFGGGYPFSHVAGADIPRALVAWLAEKPVNRAWLQASPGVVGAKADDLKVASAVADWKGKLTPMGS